VLGLIGDASLLGLAAGAVEQFAVLTVRIPELIAKTGERGLGAGELRQYLGTGLRLLRSQLGHDRLVTRFDEFGVIRTARDTAEARNEQPERGAENDTGGEAEEHCKDRIHA